MRLAYRILSSRRKVKSNQSQSKFKWLHESTGTKIKLDLIRDPITGEILRTPQFMPNGRPFIKALMPERIGFFAKVHHISTSSCLDWTSFEWTQVLLSLYDKPLSEEEATRNDRPRVEIIPLDPLPPRTPRQRILLPRNGILNRRPWALASGSPEWLERQAVVYLSWLNYETAAAFDKPELTLLKVVSNLRNYYRMNSGQTVRLVTALFNPKSGFFWSAEGITLAWDLVEGFTPSLGLNEIDGIAKQKALDIEDAVIDLLAFTRSGGRLETDALIETFQLWNPDLKTSKTAISRDVRLITGISTTSGRRGRYYRGLHLPTKEELADSAHDQGQVIHPEMDQFITSLRSKRRLDPLIAFHSSTCFIIKWVFSVEENDWVRRKFLRYIGPTSLSQVSSLMVHSFSSEAVLARERAQIAVFVEKSKRRNIPFHMTASTAI